MSLNIREIKIKITKTSPYTYQGGCLPKNKHCQGCEETGTKVHRWWEYKMELLWKIAVAMENNMQIDLKNFKTKLLEETRKHIGQGINQRKRYNN